MEKQKLALTALDHLMPRRYAVELLYFPRSNADIRSIAATLETSLKRTLEILPILSGTVQQDKDGQRGQRGQQGVLCVDAPWMDVKDILVVNDLTGCKDLVYADLRREHFPMTTTERHDFCSVLLTDKGGMKTLPAPVMMAQVSFIRGGMVLAQCLHHSFTDGPGGAVIMGLWAAFCRGDDGAKLLTESMWDRSRLMPVDGGLTSGSFGEYIDCSRDSTPNLSEAGSKDGHKQTANEDKEHHSQPTLQLDNRSEKPRMAEHKEIKRKKEIDTEIFFISRARLAALKTAVSAALPTGDPMSVPAAPTAMPGKGGQMSPQSPGQVSNGSVVDHVSHRHSASSQPYISTNDALSALLFTCITAARSSTSILSSSVPDGASAPDPSHNRPRLPRTVPLGLTVSGRRLLSPPLPETYIGNVSLFCHLDIPLSDYLDPSTKANATILASTRRPTTPPAGNASPKPTHPPTRGITPDIPTIASLAHRIRSRLLALDETYVRGLIGALHHVRDLAKVIPACRVSGIGAGAGTRILGQGEADGSGILSTGGAGELAQKAENGEASSSSSSFSWDFMITPWTTQGFYAMDWGAELLGGSGEGGEEAHDEAGVGSGGSSVRMGKCERVRIPKVRWEALDGVIIVLPMLEGGEEKGGLEVMVGLEKGVMERLKARGEWRKYAERRCD